MGIRARWARLRVARRNTRHVTDIIEKTRERGAGFRSLTEGLDTTGPMGTAMPGVSRATVYRYFPSATRLQARGQVESAKTCDAKSTSPGADPTAEQRRQLSENDDELDATRATNRELMTRLNRPHSDGSNH